MARKHTDKNYLFARLGSTRLFWRVRYGLGWVNFRRIRAGFQIQSKLSDSTTEVQYWRALSKGTVLPILLALIVGFALYAFERNISFFTGIDWLQNNIIGQYLLLALDGDAYVQMLTVIAGVTGVFLGLYFTAVSTVISNTYSSVSGDVRGLILRDRLGNNYVKLVAFLTALSVVLLAFSATGMTPFHLTIPLLAIISCVAVFAFVNLGQRAFFLSDPTLFFNTLSSELLKWVKRASVGGYQWRSPSFQQHYRKQALQSATTLATLAKISGEKPELQGESLPRLLRSLLALLTVYYEGKHQIPTDSGWYGKKFQHKQWYLTESTELEMATQTDSGLKPNEIPDVTWLEDVILEVVFKAFKTDIEAGDYQALYSKIANLPDFFSRASGSWQAGDAKKWHAKLAKDVLAKLINSKEIDETQEAYSIAVADIVASLPLSLELGFMKSVRELDSVKLRSQFTRTKWSNSDAPYKSALPPNTIKTLEQVRDGYVFEKQAHAPHKTQSWYVVELAFKNIEWALYEQWQSLMGLMETWYSETGQALADAKKYKHSATIYARAIEQAWRLDSHIEQLKEASEALRKDVKLDFKRPAWEWDKEHERVTKFRSMAIEGQAKLIPHLWNTKEPNPDMPDFFGGAVHRTGEACYEALMEGDTDKFKSLFRPYFLGILGIFESVRPQVKDWEVSSAMAWMSEPILDLFDISGYAYVLAEYHNKPELWNACKEIWDTYLTNIPQQLQSFALISDYHQTPRGVITPRATLRSRWEITLAKLLGSLPRQRTTGFYSRPPVEHQSQLIRNIAPSTDLPHMFSDATDVFTVKYLLARQDASGFDFGVHKSKIDHINRQRGDDDA